MIGKCQKAMDGIEGQRLWAVPQYTAWEFGSSMIGRHPNTPHGNAGHP
jgi:hypothetical protein